MKNLEKIRVSVVVAIYKVAPYLDKLIQSVINQTHRNIEIILVDDGSPDECGEICDKYAKEDNRIVVIHKPNGGGCDARNKGIEKVSGEYFTIMDGDDWLEPDFIEYMLGIAVSMEAEFVLSDTVFTTRDRKQVETDNVEIWSKENAVVQLLTKMVIGCWNKLYKTEMIRRTGLTFNVPWHGEGMYYGVMAAQYANKVAKGHRKVYNYRLNNASSSTMSYSVKNGINGLWNIKNIERVSPVQTDKTKYAFKYHIWFNYNYLLLTIIASKAEKEYQQEYNSCIKNIRRLLPYLIIHRGVFGKRFFGLSVKWYFIKRSMFPVVFAKKQIIRETLELKKDIMSTD